MNIFEITLKPKQQGLHRKCPAFDGLFVNWCHIVDDTVNLYLQYHFFSNSCIPKNFQMFYVVVPENQTDYDKMFAKLNRQDE